MINVRELRPGNLVLRWGAPTMICGTQVLDHTAIVLFWDGNTVDQFGCQEIHPIPLTPEWLERFGYIKDTTDKKWYKLPHRLPPIYQWKVGAFGMDGLPLNVKSLEYVHQLQNLYFALTGEELVIKMP